jgi:hypothetical protein
MKKLLIVTLLAFFVSLLISIDPTEVNAQSCTGSGSSTYDTWKCSRDPPTGCSYCEDTGSVTNSGTCGWKDGRCEWEEESEPRCSTTGPEDCPTGCIVSDQCAFNYCGNPSGCSVTSTSPTPTPTPAPSTAECNQYCGGDIGCRYDLGQDCISNVCRNINCPEETDCTCPDPTKDGGDPTYHGRLFGVAFKDNNGNGVYDTGDERFSNGECGTAPNPGFRVTLTSTADAKKKDLYLGEQ